MFKKLQEGDTVGVIAPSSKIDKDDLEVINNSVLLLEGRGLKIKFGNNAFKDTLGYSATPQEKAEDINKMFADKEVKMIFCVSGGFNSNSVPLISIMGVVLQYLHILFILQYFFFYLIYSFDLHFKRFILFFV